MKMKSKRIAAAILAVACAATAAEMPAFSNSGIVTGITANAADGYADLSTADIETLCKAYSPKELIFENVEFDDSVDGAFITGSLKGYIAKNADNQNVAHIACILKDGTRLALPADSSNLFSSNGNLKDFAADFTNIDLHGLYMGNVEIASKMFFGCEKLKSADLSGIVSDSLIDASYMFSGSSIESANLNGWSAASLTNMSHMFENCVCLTDIDIKGMKNTGNVTDLSSMFAGCSSLSKIDMSGMDFGSVTNMELMLINCTSLVDADLSNMKTDSLQNISSMFCTGTSAIEKVDLSGWNTSSLKKINSVFSASGSLKQLNLNGWTFESVTEMNNAFSYIPETACVCISQDSFRFLDKNNAITKFVSRHKYTEEGVCELCGEELDDISSKYIDESRIVYISNADEFENILKNVTDGKLNKFTLRLVSDITLDGTLLFENKEAYVIDLNGHSIIGISDDWVNDTAILEFQGGTNVKIINTDPDKTGTIRVKDADNDSYNNIIYAEDCTLTIDNVAFNTSSSDTVEHIIELDDATLNLKNVDINSTGNTSGDEGCIIYNSNSKLSAENCIFINGKSDDYAPIYIDVSSENDKVIFNHCKFSSNKGEQGGSIYVNNGVVTFTECCFDGNISDEEGGAVYVNDGDAAFTDCCFDGNTANDDGGAVYLCDGKTTFKNVEFSKNRAANGEGGAVYSDAKNTAFSSCTFDGNSAAKNGGAVITYYNTAFTDCIFTNNTVANMNYNGGALCAYSGGVKVSGCKFTGNKALRGGAIYVYDDDLIVSNSVITGNSASEYGGGIYCSSDCDGAVFGDASNLLLITDNMAKQGGGVYYNTMSNNTFIGQVMIYSNYQTDIEASTYIKDKGFESNFMNNSYYANTDFSKISLDPVNHAWIGWSVEGSEPDFVETPKLGYTTVLFCDDYGSAEPHYFYYDDEDFDRSTTNVSAGISVNTTNIENVFGKALSESVNKEEVFATDKSCSGANVYCSEPIDADSIQFNITKIDGVTTTLNKVYSEETSESYKIVYKVHNHQNEGMEHDSFYTVIVPKENPIAVEINTVKDGEAVSTAAYYAENESIDLSYDNSNKDFAQWSAYDEEGYDITKDLFGGQASNPSISVPAPVYEDCSKLTIKPVTTNNPIVFTGASMQISDSFNINMQFRVDSLSILDQVKTFDFTDTDGNVTTYKINDYGNVEGGSYYINFTASVPAKNYCDKVTISINGMEFTYSVKKYFDDVRYEYAETDSLVQLVDAAEDYCQSAAYYFGVSDDAPLIQWTSEEAKAFGNNSAYNMASNEQFAENMKKREQETGEKIFAYSLLLKSCTQVRLYFKNAEGEIIKEETDFAPGNYNAVSNTTLNPLNYIYDMLNDPDTDENLAELCKALYKFYEATRQYSNIN